MNNITANYLRTNQIIHHALSIGSIMFLLVTLLLKNFEITFKLENNIFLIAVLALSFIAIFFSTFFRNKLKEKANNKTFDEKLILFREKSMIIWAIIESATLFAIVNFLIWNSFYFAIIAILLTIVQFFNRPSLNRVAEDLSLNQNEIKQLKSL